MTIFEEQRKSNFLDEQSAVLTESSSDKNIFKGFISAAMMINKKIEWVNIEKILLNFSDFLTESSSEPINKVVSTKETASTSINMNKEDDPLLNLPLDLRENITVEYYEAGMSSMMQEYIKNIYLNDKKMPQLQELMNTLYGYAVKKDKHTLAWNILVVLSQIPFKYLGDWACVLAVAATRNKYLDVVEMGVRCFENWEDRSACEFLKQCRFSEKWLQQYADEVYEYLIKNEEEIDVLSTKDYAWQMAGRNVDRSDNAT